MAFNCGVSFGICATRITRLDDAGNVIAGANAYVTKPYGVAELFEAIESAKNWRARIERQPQEGDIAVQPGSEIALLQGLNDLMVHLR